MELLLPLGCVAYQHQGKSTVDLALGTPWVREHKLFCGVREDLDHQSDHLPVATTIMMEVEADPIRERRLWQCMNKETFKQSLEESLPHPSSIHTAKEIDQCTEQIVDCIRRAIEASTPKARPCARSIPA